MLLYKQAEIRPIKGSHKFPISLNCSYLPTSRCVTCMALADLILIEVF